MTFNGLTIEQAATTTDSSRLSDWCIDAAGGDSLLAVDLAITAHAMRRRLLARFAEAA
jgi:hypothetical protein